MSGHKARILRERGPRPSVLSEAALEWFIRNPYPFKLPPRQLTTFGRAEAAMLRSRDRRKAKRVVGLQVKAWQRHNAEPLRIDEDGNVFHKLDVSYGGRRWLLRGLIKKQAGSWGHTCDRITFNKTRRMR